jgi:hypothetical protein
LTFLLWAGFGIALASALLHGAIGLRRPLAWTHLSFGALAIFLCGYLIGQKQEYAAHLPQALVSIERRQFLVSAGLLAALAWFTSEYTGIRVRRAIVLGFHGVIALFAIADLVTPYGGFLGSMPRLATEPTFGHEQVTIYTASLGPLQIGWLSLVGLFLMVAIGMGTALARRGELRRGIVLVCALSLMIVFPVVDVARDAVRGHWPHFGALGVVGLALIMSIDLAVDFRAKEDALELAFVELQRRNEKIGRMLESSQALRDQLNTPLQTLELEFDKLVQPAPHPAPRPARVRRALDRLTDLSRRLQRASDEDGKDVLT